MTATEASKTNRSSLACLPCRSRHLKCDGRKPTCTRCVGASGECRYAKSRRGGLDRAQLAERRRVLAQAEGLAPGDAALDGFSPRFAAESSSGMSLGSLSGDSGFVSDAPISPGYDTDGLEETYYRTFHRFHPLVLPRGHLARYQHRNLQPLLAVIRLIGHIYTSHSWSDPLEAALETSLLEPIPWQGDLLAVQTQLLYSIALFWYGRRADSRRQMDRAVQTAINAGMYRQSYAIENGEGDAVLEESHRRTWWMLFIIQAYYAGTEGTLEFSIMDVDASVDLPCEEGEYETGKIPPPKTVRDFESREFALAEVDFSSFAYLIGAVKCAALAIASTPRIATREDSATVIQAADAVLDGWLLLLPKGKDVIAEDGEVDELMFQAHLVVHV